MGWRLKGRKKIRRKTFYKTLGSSYFLQSVVSERDCKNVRCLIAVTLFTTDEGTVLSTVSTTLLDLVSKFSLFLLCDFFGGELLDFSKLLSSFSESVTGGRSLKLSTSSDSEPVEISALMKTLSETSQESSFGTESSLLILLDSSLSPIGLK